MQPRSVSCSVFHRAYKSCVLCFIADGYANNSDSYLLSATCDPNSVFVEIFKNPESNEDLSLIYLYAIDYNCIGDDSLTVSLMVYSSLHVSIIYI